MLTWYSKKLPVISGKNLIKMYEKLGFRLERHGRHPMYSLNGKRKFPCPEHNNDDLREGTLKDILLQSGCFFEEGVLRMKTDKEWLEDMKKRKRAFSNFTYVDSNVPYYSVFYLAMEKNKNGRFVCYMDEEVPIPAQGTGKTPEEAYHSAADMLECYLLYCADEKPYYEVVDRSDDPNYWPVYVSQE